MQGKRFSGVPIYQEFESFDGKPVSSPDEFDLELITYKEIHGCESRTIGNYAAQMAIMPENFVNLNAIDAKRLGLVDGDTVRVESRWFQGELRTGAGPGAKQSGRQGPRLPRAAAGGGQRLFSLWPLGLRGSRYRNRRPADLRGAGAR